MVGKIWEDIDTLVGNFERALIEAKAATVGSGKILALINRPSESVHEPVDTLYLDPDTGIKGDRWINTAWIRRPDGSPDPRVQVSLTNANVMKCFIGDEVDSIFRCGDNVYTDLSLTETALPEGSRLLIGEAVVEVSDVVNDACGKFVQRFGVDAFNFIREPENVPLRLRGIFCQIVTPGWLRVGDEICVLSNVKSAV